MGGYRKHKGPGRGTQPGREEENHAEWKELQEMEEIAYVLVPTAISQD